MLSHQSEAIWEETCAVCHAPYRKHGFIIRGDKIYCKSCDWFAANKETLTKKSQETRKRIVDEFKNQENPTLQSVGDVLGVTRERIRQLCAKMGFNYRKYHATMVKIYRCVQCGDEFEVVANGYAKPFCSRKCRSRYVESMLVIDDSPRRGVIYPSEKTQRLPTKKYRTVYIGHNDKGQPKYQYAHRMVMEKILGRPLRPDEHVHHIDGDGTNNRPGNLQLLSHAEHAKQTYQSVWAKYKLNKPHPIFIRKGYIKKGLL